MIQILIVSFMVSVILINGVLQLVMVGWILPADYYEEVVPTVRNYITEYGADLAKLHGELAQIMPEEGVSYKIINQTGKALYEYGVDEKVIKKWWDKSIDKTEQKIIIGWIKPYVLQYLPINKEGACCDAVILGYRLYNTSTLPILKVIAPYFNLSIIVIPFGVLAITLILYARRFLKVIKQPLNILQNGIKNIEENNLEFKIETDNQDEIGQLCLSFEKMRVNLKESLEGNWKKEEERRSIINGLTHDLRTPLTVIKGHTELMLEDILTEEQMKDSTVSIQKNVERLTRLVQALNEINKWQQTELLDKKQMVNMEEWLEERLKDYNILAQPKHINIEFRIEGKKDPVYLGSEAWNQILDNLMSNSLRFTPQGGKILIQVVVDDENIKLKVEDSGCGFTNEDLKQAVVMFYQGDKSRNSGKHYGIGLYVVDYLVKKMNGSMNLYRASLGGAGIYIVINIRDKSRN